MKQILNCTIWAFVSIFFFTSCGNQKAEKKSLEFVVLGDTWYEKNDKKPYYDLINKINEYNPEFSVHIGDIRGGKDDVPCSDEQYKAIYESFQTFEKPLIYTPGDNEWTDCWRKNNTTSSLGEYEPEERLIKIREIFYPNNESLGKNRIKLERQSNLSSDYSKYVENQRWWSNDILFLTLHIPGSNNGWLESSVEETSEFQNRSVANLNWLKNSFKLADSLNAKAVVMFFHAEIAPIYPEGEDKEKPVKYKRHQINTIDGFKKIRDEIKNASINFKKPVLQVYGDYHKFTYTQPYKNHGNVWRLQTFGSPDHKAVVVKINENKPWFFELTPLY